MAGEPSWKNWGPSSGAPVAKPPGMICPNVNCGYRGDPKKKARGSLIVGCVLCLFFLLPGLIYFMLRSGYRYLCPQCGMQIGSDT